MAFLLRNCLLENLCKIKLETLLLCFFDGGEMEKINIKIAFA